jgi:chromosome segregation ATPase
LLCETRQTQALASVDEQLAGYKKDMEYRLSGLESSSGDVDTLENDLRIAMDEVRKRILTEFDTFTDEQQKKHSEFAESIKTDSDTIENELKVLESRIDELKTSSVSSVSEKLKGFETEFDNNLKMSTDKINEDIATWKNTFDGKISAFTGDYENQRRSLESKYSEDLKEKLAVLQEKNNEQVERTATGLKTMQESVQNQIDDIKNLIDGFANETRNKITESSAASDVFLKNASDQYKEQITGQLGKLQIELTERMKAFEDAMTVRQDTSSGTIDAALSEFNTWKQHLNQQLDESSDIFKEQLKNLKDSSEQKIAETTKAISKNLTGYSDDIKKQEDSLSQQLADLHTQADNSVATYEERSKDILDKLQGMYEDMLKDTEARVRTQMNDSSATLNNLKEEIKKTTAESSANQAKLVFKMQNDANDMQSRMSEISKELQTIRSQMQVYDKADQMKKQLDEKITSLEDDFSRIDTYSSTAATLTSQYNAICKMNDDISSRVKDFETQKNKVENLGKEYDKMINLSGTIDQKVKDLQTTSDDLTQMEVAVRNFQDTLTAISGRYDRLEQKQPVVDRVMKDVDASFDNMKALEDRLKNCSRQADSLPQEIKDLQNNVDELLKNGPKIGDAVSHISSLQSVLEETDKRIETINSARQGIGRSEERLNQLSSDIDSKFKLLGQLTKQDLEKHPSKGSDHISPQERESIKALKRQGWSVSEIARSMKRTETEIELILEMPDA